MNRKDREKRSIFKKLACVPLIAAVAAALCVGANAADGFERAQYTAGERSQYGYAPISFSATYKAKDTSSVLRKAENLPKKYDSRDENLVTSVKDQDKYGACWSFSSMSIAETSAIKEFPSKFNNENTDFSEAHLAYFTFANANDPLKLTAGDYTTLYGTDFLDSGGNLYFSTFTLAKWFGVADEATAPYKTATPTTKYSNNIAYNKNKMILENSYWISSSDTKTIKKLIMQYGSCAISYYHNELLLNTNTNAYYQTLNKYANHSVTIVGWDDNYPKENFGRTFLSRPSSNGAWLIKNSYGDEFGDNGYIWLSYEERSLSSDDAVFFDMTETTDYDRNYQYDGTAAFGTYYTKDKLWMSNIFTATANETINAFSFVDVDTTATYKYQIYTGVTSSSNPTSGKAAFEGYVSCDREYPGYHTVKLPQEVFVKQGEKFAVVIYVANNGKNVHAPCDYSGYIDDMKTMHSHAASKKGRSLISSDGKKWEDLYDEGANENLRIKAFTKDADDTPKTLKPSIKSVSLVEGTTKKVTFTATPSYADTACTWKSSNTAVAKVSSAGTITAVAPGSAKITYTSKKNSKLTGTITVTVTAKDIPQKLTLSGSTSITLEAGATKKLTLKPSPSYASAACTWKSSNTAVAKVSSAGTITAVSAGSAKITYKSTKNSKLTGTVTVTVNPKKVTGFKVKSITATSYSFTWTADKTVTGYYVYKLNEKTSKKELVTKTTKNLFEKTKLKEGQKGTYYVVAYKNVKTGSGKTVTYKSAYSGAFKIYTKPAKVNVKASKVAATSVKLTWSKVSNADKYTVYVYDKNNKCTKTTVSASSTTVTVKSLKKNSAYTICASASVKVSGKYYEGAKGTKIKVKTLK